MQAKTEAVRDFFSETEAISERFGISLRALAEEMNVAQATFFGSRTGKIPTTKRTWRKLGEAVGRLERAADPEPPPSSASDPPACHAPPGDLAGRISSVEETLLNRLEAQAERLDRIESLLSRLAEHLPGE